MKSISLMILDMPWIRFSSYPADKIAFYMKPKGFIVKTEWEEENLPVIDINNPSETYSSLR